MDHDQNFKNLILDYPRESLEFFASEEAAGVDAGVRITPIRQEQLKDRLGDSFRELDTPLLVEWPDGRREGLLFVIEEETKPGSFSIHRLARYCLHLAELLKTNRVVPVVIFLKGGKYPTDLTLGGDRHHYLQFHYLISELSAIPAEDYLESNNIVARLNLPNMRYDHERRIEIYAAAVNGLITLEKDERKQRKYIDFIDIYANLSEDELKRYQNSYLREVELMSGLGQALRQEGLEKGIHQGIEQGIEQGMQKGMQKGEALVLARLMERRFGPLPEPIQRRIESADAETLLRWSERILVANSMEEVLSDQGEAL